jgi:tight adherence protein B
VLVGAVSGLLGFSLPILWVLVERSRRSQKLSEQLPEALDMIVRSLRAGHGVSAGFKLVATEMPVPIAVEFGRCFEEQNVGVEFRVAVENMTKRVPQNLDLRIFAVSVVIQHETGGNLVEILEQIAGMLRERFKFYGKLRALTAEGRVSGIVLGSLPFVSAVLISILNPEYLVPLFVDPIGRMVLFAGVVSWVLGFLWLRTLAQVEF